MTTVIQAEGLGKKYRRGLSGRRSDTLRDTFANFIRSPLAAFRRPQHETFWALRDVSLEVREGEVLGLIGRNGAGKTTLLKILSRITRPTTGWAEIRGRVRSLLEVGTGFHGELSGRENAYLSGSILGMRKSEIDSKFDDIVAFAEIDKFIDTPIKHYSSGMYVRLAFAVAAHLEPEILLVDEVLAVGDLSFQKKCLGKMGDVARCGRTVVFVSHQMNQIRRLCHRALWIDAGQVRQDGLPQEVLAAYESVMLGGERTEGFQRGSRLAQFLQWQIGDPPSDQDHVLSTLGPTTINFVVELSKPIRHGEHGVALFNAQRQLMWACAARNLVLEPGVHVFSHSFPSIPLRPGAYQWQVSLWEAGEQLDLWDCLPEMVVATEDHQHHMDGWNGILNLPSRFTLLDGLGGHSGASVRLDA
jgi:lipopolysaccharide transport system ATP-binding protein